MGWDVKPPNRKRIVGSQYVRRNSSKETLHQSKVLESHRRETMHRSTVVSEPLREDHRMELHNDRNSSRVTNKVRWGTSSREQPLDFKRTMIESLREAQTKHR